MDCRNLIEFCRAFEQHRRSANSMSITGHRNNHIRKKRHNKTFNPLFHPFCDHSPCAAVDVIMLFLVLGALGFLMVPYFKFIFKEVSELLPVAFDLLGDIICDAPIPYVIGTVTTFAFAIAVWIIFDHQSRKCQNPYCRGMKEAMEFDIQLETEECVKFMPPTIDSFDVRPLNLGQDQKELEAELKRMAPVNGRTVLILRERCGCPTGRIEVWGPKKLRNEESISWSASWNRY